MEREKKNINLWLAPHLGDMLDNLCAWYDTDATNCIRRLILDDYERIQGKMGGTAKSPEVFSKKKDTPIVTEFEVRDQARAGTQKPAGRPRKKSGG